MIKLIATTFPKKLEGIQRLLYMKMMMTTTIMWNKMDRGNRLLTLAWLTGQKLLSKVVYKIKFWGGGKREYQSIATAVVRAVFHKIRISLCK